MEPILNKIEIADLISAIRKGTVSLDLDNSEQAAFLKCKVVDLFHLAKPDSKQFRIPNFDIILDIFCRLYSTSLTNQLQRTFSVTRTALETHTFEDFMSGKNNPGAIGILDMSPLKTGALIFFDPNLSFSMIEIMLGASSELDTLHLDRQLTTIELTILKTVISSACTDINKSFSQLLELNTTLIKLENNGRLVSIVEPESEVIVGTFLVKSGDQSGEIHLVFPFVTLEPLRDLLRELLSISSASTSTWQEIIEDEIQNVPATVIAQSGQLSLTIEQILHMKEGDIFDIDYDPNTPLRVLVEEQLKYFAIPGTHNGKKAISLTGVYK